MTETMTRRSRRSRAAEEPEEETRTSGRRSRSREEEPEEARPSSRRMRSARDEDDERPKTRTKMKSQSGWGSYQSEAEKHSSGDFAKDFKVPTEPSLIKFLDAEPFLVYSEHWIERAGKKSFVCLGDGCPLCGEGDSPRVYTYLNILDLTDVEQPVVKPLKAGKRLTDIIFELATASKTSPLNRIDLYFEISKSGKGSQTQFRVDRVRSDELDEWDMDPFSEEELEEFKTFGEEDVLFVTSKQDLREIADELD